MTTQREEGRLLRIMSLWKFLEGKDLTREARVTLAQIFGVSERTIYRDLRLVRFLQQALYYLEWRNGVPVCRGRWKEIVAQLQDQAERKQPKTPEEVYQSLREWRLAPRAKSSRFKTK